MDGNTRVDLEAQLHVRALNTEYRDFQQALETIGPANHNRFLALPR
jgi:hypothetical protein